MTEVRQRFDVRQQQQHQQPSSSSLLDNDVSGEAEDHAATSSPALVPADLKLVQLRTELKKLGLSPSGLKHVLVKRLEEALARLGRGGSQARPNPNNNNNNEDDDEEDDGGDDDDAREPEVQPQALSFPSINRPPLLARSSSVKSFARRGGQHSPHASDDGADDALEDLRQGRQRHRRQPQQQQQRSPHGDEGDDAEGFDDDYDEAYVGAHASAGSLLDRKDAPSKKRKIPSSSSSFSSSSTSSSSSSSKQRSRHGKPANKKHRPSLSSLSSLVDAMATTPLSGNTFVKEARYAHPQPQQQQPVEEIKSLEQFRFEDSTFHFSYQFWRGHTLLHSFEIEAGTFTVLDEADAEPGSPPPSVDAPATSSSSTTTTSTTSTSAATTTTTTTTTTRQRRVVLRWPSPVYYPLLQTWRFHQTYSHFLLHEPTSVDVASSVPSSPAAAVAPPSIFHSTPSSYPSSPLTAPALASAAVPCLISRLGSVFVPSGANVAEE